MVPFDAHDSWIVSNQRDQARRIGASIDEVTKADNTIFFAKSQAMEQGSKRGNMPVNVTNSDDTMPRIQPCLKIGLKAWVSARGAKWNVE
jgi:hypothetical protein